MQTTLLARLGALAPPAALSFALSFSTPAGAQEPFKIAYIDPLTGPFASVGELMLTHTQYAVEDINAKGGVLKGQWLQLLLFDNRVSSQESQNSFQTTIHQ